MPLDFNELTVVTLFIRKVNYRHPVDAQNETGFVLNPFVAVKFNDGTEGQIHIQMSGPIGSAGGGAYNFDPDKTVFKFETLPAFDGTSPPFDKRSSVV